MGSGVGKFGTIPGDLLGVKEGGKRKQSSLLSEEQREEIAREQRALASAYNESEEGEVEEDSPEAAAMRRLQEDDERKQREINGWRAKVDACSDPGEMQRLLRKKPKGANGPHVGVLRGTVGESPLLDKLARGK